MPRIAEFDGIVITMYFRDHNPPHFHASYQGQEALVAIATGDFLKGSLPGAQAKSVKAWALVHTAMLSAKWAELQG